MKPNDHSWPSAPTRFFSSQAVNKPLARPSANNGAVAAQSRQVILSRFHHARISRTGASVQVMVLLSSAQTNSSSASGNQDQRSGAVASSGQKRNQASTVSSANVKAKRFLGSALQATVSTCTG